MAINATINTDRKTISFELPLEALTPSKSGKSRVGAATRGNKATTAVIDGRPVMLGVNAYIVN